MKEENNNKQKESTDMTKRKWYSVMGFLISITLLSIAIFLSINQENNERLARLNQKETSKNLIEIASTDLSKDINEVKEEQLSNMIQSSTNQANENQTILNNDNTSKVTEKKVYTNAPSEVEKELFSDEGITSEEESSSKTTASEVIDILGNNEDDTQNNETNEKNEKSSQFIKPVEGEVTKGYSMDSLVYSDTLQEWVTHRGIDIKADKLTEVKASQSGKIKSIKNDPRFGLSVTVEHKDGFETVYSCLVSADNIKEGDEIAQGDIIGNVGNSGVFEVSDGMHLHFEMLKDGEFINPEIYLK